MNAKNLLKRLNALGVSLQVELDSLRIHGKKEALTKVLLNEIKAHKNELIKELTSPGHEPIDPPLTDEQMKKLASVVKTLMKIDRESKFTLHDQD